MAPANTAPANRQKPFKKMGIPNDASKWETARRAVAAGNAFRSVIVSHDPKSKAPAVVVSSQQSGAEPLPDVDVFGMPSRAHAPPSGRRPPNTFYEPPGHTHAPFPCAAPDLRSAPATPTPPGPEDASPRRGTPSSHAAQQRSSVFPNQPPRHDYSPAPRAQPPPAAGPAPASHAAQQRSSIFSAYGVEGSHQAYPTDGDGPSAGGSRRASAADRGWQPTDRAAELTSAPCSHVQMQSSSALPMGKHHVASAVAPPEAEPRRTGSHAAQMSSNLPWGDSFTSARLPHAAAAAAAAAAAG